MPGSADGEPDAMTLVHNQYPRKDLFLTEPSVTESPHPTTIGIAPAVDRVRCRIFPHRNRLKEKPTADALTPIGAHDTIDAPPKGTSSRITIQPRNHAHIQANPAARLGPFPLQLKTHWD